MEPDSKGLGPLSDNEILCYTSPLTLSTIGRLSFYPPLQSTGAVPK